MTAGLGGLPLFVIGVDVYCSAGSSNTGKASEQAAREGAGGDCSIGGASAHGLVAMCDIRGRWSPRYQQLGGPAGAVKRFKWRNTVSPARRFPRARECNTYPFSRRVLGPQVVGAFK